MTVSSTTNRKAFTGDAVTTSFGTSPVVFFETSELVVQAVVTATGVATTLVENTDYTVSGGSGSTGTVNLAGGSDPYGAPASTETLVIRRVLPFTQTDDFVNNDINDAEVLEDNLDRGIMLMQQLDEEQGRALKVAASEGEQTDIAVAGKAGYYLRRNAAGTAFELAVGDQNDTTFTQSGTGAVERSVTAKLAETLSVLDFGAVGDGVTDDTAAFAAAIAAAGTSGRVIAPEGYTYLIGNLTVTGKSYFTLECRGTVKRTGANALMTIGDGSTRCYASQFIFNKVDGIDKSQHGIICQGATQCRIYAAHATLWDHWVRVVPTGSFGATANCGGLRIDGGVIDFVNRAVYMKGGSSADNHAEGVKGDISFISNHAEYGIYKDGSGTGSLKFSRFWAEYDAFAAGATFDIYDSEPDSGSFYYMGFSTSATVAFDATADGAATSYVIDNARARILTGTGWIFRGDPTNGLITFRPHGNDVSQVQLNTNAGGLELKAASGNPYVDFANALADDYDFRIQQDASGRGLTLSAASGEAELRVGGLVLVDGITAPSTRVGAAVIYVDTADGDLKIKFGDGTVKTIVVDT